MLMIVGVFFKRDGRKPADQQGALLCLDDAGVAVVERRIANDFGRAPGLALVAAAHEMRFAPRTNMKVAVTGENGQQLARRSERDRRPADVAARLATNDPCP